MGTFIYALDAATGNVLWVNDETGAQYIRQLHSAPAFAGVAPQGALVATAEALIVPGGRSVPAVFDRQTGELRYFEINAGGKGTGGSFVAAKWGRKFSVCHVPPKYRPSSCLRVGFATPGVLMMNTASSFCSNPSGEWPCRSFNTRLYGRICI